MIKLWHKHIHILSLPVDSPPLHSLFLFFSLFSSYIAQRAKDQTAQWPTRWKDNEPHLRQEAQIVVNRYIHETQDLQRFPDRVIDTDARDYIIEEKTKKPSNVFQSYTFHHTSAGDNRNLCIFHHLMFSSIATLLQIKVLFF